MDYESYAIWWAPRPGTGLAQFGAEWTGWCADRGVVSAGRRAAVSRVAGRCVPGSLGSRGLHASVRSPFRLGPGCSSWALEDALADVAERTEAIRLPSLELTVFDGRVALALSQPDGALSRLVAAVADAVRPFALPLPYAAEPDGAPQPGGGDDASLERFHLPLTDRLDLGRAFEIVAHLGPRLAPILGRRQRIDDLALVGDPGGGRPWRVLQRHALAGETSRRDGRVPAGMAWRGPSLLTPLAGVDRRRATA